MKHAMKNTYEAPVSEEIKMEVRQTILDNSLPGGAGGGGGNDENSED